ncbi:MAG: Bug family tripartite tricarboxylate transporter substrate binding protein [Burkholderiales bacterium]
MKYCEMEWTKLGACALSAALLNLAGTQALAQTYPAKAIRVIVPAAPGGAFDLYARALSAPLGASLGQPLIVDNRAAVSGISGMEFAARAPADGYTLLVAGNPQFIFNKHFYAKLPYDPQKDFAPVGPIATLPFALYVHESVGARSLQEFIAHMKANPGKLNYGSGGVGQAFHLAMELLKQRTGTDIVHVPYKGNAPALQDFFTGRVQVMFYPASSQILGQIKEGKLRALASATDRRIPALPEVPTFDEAGVPGIGRDVMGWVAMFAPAGAPTEIVARLNRDLAAAATQPEVTKTHAGLSALPASGSAEQLAERIGRELALWGPVVKTLGIALE